MPDDPAAAKRRLRRHLRQVLHRLADEVRQREEAANAATFLAWLAAAGWPALGAYVAQPHECATTRVLDACWRRGQAVWLPRLLAGGELAWHPVTGADQLAPGSHGIREPRPERVAAEEPPADLWLLVPGLAFTAVGDRLGQGGGCYDRLLARRRRKTVGYGFSCQLLAELPRLAHDIRVDRVLCGGTFVTP
jgi:5-formyltetrahydrofolate cyclo-ligase